MRDTPGSARRSTSTRYTADDPDVSANMSEPRVMNDYSVSERSSFAGLNFFSQFDFRSSEQYGRNPRNRTGKEKNIPSSSFRSRTKTRPSVRHQPPWPTVDYRRSSNGTAVCRIDREIRSAYRYEDGTRIIYTLVLITPSEVPPLVSRVIEIRNATRVLGFFFLTVGHSYANRSRQYFVVIAVNGR